MIIARMTIAVVNKPSSKDGGGPFQISSCTSLGVLTSNIFDLKQ